ncbi:MAG: cysteine desulfurase family protein [Candidatus Sericytochromatia bacterium]|nr:cysteine desulfurase family protein [Candidatus Sericytochromatia bacterium]
MKRIYLDHQATTPLDPAVLEAMMPYLTDRFGNAGSRSHAYGWEAEEAVETARGTIARALHATDREIAFTSGATEAINTALFGAAEALAEQGRHIVTTAVEHPATLAPLRKLAERGWRVTYLPVDRDGVLDPGYLENALTTGTVLISVLHGNNEIGTLQPLTEIGRVARRHGIVLHVDAAQAFGKVALDVNEMGIDLLSMSAHKLHGPKGVGALYVRRREARLKLPPLLHGGGQERGLRSGTLNVPGIVGFGKAAELALVLMPEESSRLAGLRDRMARMLSEALPAVHLVGHPQLRLPTNLTLRFEGVRADDVLLNLRGIAASSGAACSFASQQPSHVLRAIGLTDEQAASTLRFGLGRFTTEDDLEEAVSRLVEVVSQLREVSPEWARLRAAPRDGW